MKIMKEITTKKILKMNKEKRKYNEQNKKII